MRCQNEMKVENTYNCWGFASELEDAWFHVFSELCSEDSTDAVAPSELREYVTLPDELDLVRE